MESFFRRHLDDEKCASVFSKVSAHFCHPIFGRLFICFSTSVIYEFEAISISFRMTPKNQKYEHKNIRQNSETGIFFLRGLNKLGANFTL